MNCRILVLEKSTPNLGINYVQDLRRSIEYIKNKYPGKVYILGVSMGGILLYTYLSEGYDSADGYITLCSPVNLEYFYESVRSNYVFRREAEKSFKILGISNIEELLTLCGVDQNYTSNLLSKIKNGKWHKKHLAIIGSDDILTSSFKDDIECINYIEVSGGYHCCLNTIWYACRSISYMSQGYTVRSTVKKVLEEVSLIS